MWYVPDIENPKSVKFMTLPICNSRSSDEEEEEGSEEESEDSESEDSSEGG